MSGRRGLLIAAMAAVVVAVAALGLAATVSGPRQPTVRVEPQVSFKLPPSSTSCTGATSLPDGAQQVPLTVSTVAGQVAESVDVCIAGHGPYPFVLDSGAGQSTIDAGLARRLHLPSSGPASLFAGVGCTGTARPVAVRSWSLDGIALASQQLTSATLPQIGGPGEPDGLLGSDVLSRFGAVRINFATGTLVLPGPEGAPLSGTVPSGSTGAPPASLTTGGGTLVPLTVSSQLGNVSLNVAVRFGTGPRRTFVVDTGSSQSVVATSVAAASSLQHTDLAQRQSTVCSVITVPLVRSGHWSVPGVTLHVQLVGETGFGAISVGGIQGLLGSDQLERFGWVVLDYAGGSMLLG